MLSASLPDCLSVCVAVGLEELHFWKPTNHSVCEKDPEREEERERVFVRAYDQRVYAKCACARARVCDSEKKG